MKNVNAVLHCFTFDADVRQHVVSVFLIYATASYESLLEMMTGLDV